ncbi:hypothetical protein [Streptomyces sp. NPDC017940]|uniref:hypothetical protein n=1 Tax=Streptomyces sp. NPDC017940 TaxID=3365017 RepID=UPI0037B61E1A
MRNPLDRACFSAVVDSLLLFWRFLGSGPGARAGLRRVSDDAAPHDEVDGTHHVDVAQRITRYGDKIGLCARSDRAEVGALEEFGGWYRSRELLPAESCRTADLRRGTTRREVPRFALFPGKQGEKRSHGMTHTLAVCLAGGRPLKVTVLDDGEGEPGGDEHGAGERAEQGREQQQDLGHRATPVPVHVHVRDGEPLRQRL